MRWEDVVVGVFILVWAVVGAMDLWQYWLHFTKYGISYFMLASALNAGLSEILPDEPSFLGMPALLALFYVVMVPNFAFLAYEGQKGLLYASERHFEADRLHFACIVIGLSGGLVDWYRRIWPP